MPTKRQIGRIVGRAFRELPKSPEALQKSLDTWRKVCFDTLQEELLHDQSIPDGAILSSRAISMIRRRCERLVKGQVDLDREIRANADWQSYVDELRQSQVQDKRLYAQLPEFAWAEANECVQESVTAAVSWIWKSGYETFRPAVDHMLAIGMSSKFKNPRSRNMSAVANRYTPDFWRAIIRTGGGAKYFLCYAVAVAMADQLMAVSYVVQGRVTDLDPFATPRLLDLIKVPCEFWTSRNQPIAMALAFVPELHRAQFVASLAAQRKSLERTFDYVKREANGGAREKALLEKQAATLRKRADTAEEQAAHLRASNQALLSSLRDTASKTAAHLASTEHSGQSDSYVAELRAKDTQIGLLRNSLAETVEQLALTRDLLTVFLEPSPEAFAVPDRLNQEQSPEQWRIVFVGGHERLHSKLRKQMRNAVFLHPDQSHFAPETFKGADAVIFSIGYCSHALAYRAADEVRRHGLRAGYSNFTNVEMVLDEIRVVLFPNGENPDQKAA